MTAGQAIRAARLKAGLSLRGTAAKAGVSPTYLCQVEQDNVAPPTADRLERLAQLVGLEKRDLWRIAGRTPAALEKYAIDLHEALERLATQAEMTDDYAESSGGTLHSAVKQAKAVLEAIANHKEW